MPETSTHVAPVSDRPTEEVYRPLSGLAVAAFGIAAVYALVIGIVGGLCLVSRTPMFLNSWTLTFPLVAIVLALAARQHLRYAEGTRSGDSLVSWGLWLSLVSGSVYLSYYLATFWVVKMQAETFVNNWFDRIKKDELGQAFLDTLPAEDRTGNESSSLADMMQHFGQGKSTVFGTLPKFLGSEVICMLRNGGKDMQVEELGIRDLDYNAGRYTVLCSYRVRTLEGEFDLVLQAVSRDQRKRSWQLTGYQLEGSPRLTPLGEAHSRWRIEAHRMVLMLGTKRMTGDLFNVFLDTLPAPAQRRHRAEFFGYTLLMHGTSNAGLLPALAHVGVRDSLYANRLSGFVDFLKGSLVNTEQLPDSAIRGQVVQSARTIFRPETAVMIRAAEGPGRLIPAEPNQPVRYEHDIEVSQYSLGGQPVGRYLLAGRWVLESDEKEPDPKLNQVHWHLARFELIFAMEPPAKEPRGTAGGNRRGAIPVQ